MNPVWPMMCTYAILQELGKIRDASYFTLMGDMKTAYEIIMADYL